MLLYSSSYNGKSSIDKFYIQQKNNSVESMTIFFGLPPSYNTSLNEILPSYSNLSASSLPSYSINPSRYGASSEIKNFSNICNSFKNYLYNILKLTSTKPTNKSKVADIILKDMDHFKNINAIESSIISQFINDYADKIINLSDTQIQSFVYNYAHAHTIGSEVCKNHIIAVINAHFENKETYIKYVGKRTVDTDKGAYNINSRNFYEITTILNFCRNDSTCKVIEKNWQYVVGLADKTYGANHCNFHDSLDIFVNNHSLRQEIKTSLNNNTFEADIFFQKLLHTNKHGVLCLNSNDISKPKQLSKLLTQVIHLEKFSRIICERDINIDTIKNLINVINTLKVDKSTIDRLLACLCLSAELDDDGSKLATVTPNVTIQSQNGLDNMAQNLYDFYRKSVIQDGIRYSADEIEKKFQKQFVGLNIDFNELANNPELCTMVATPKRPNINDVMLPTQKFKAMIEKADIKKLILSGNAYSYDVKQILDCIAESIHKKGSSLHEIDFNMRADDISYENVSQFMRKTCRDIRKITLGIFKTERVYAAIFDAIAHTMPPNLHTINERSSNDTNSGGESIGFYYSLQKLYPDNRNFGDECFSRTSLVKMLNKTNKRGYQNLYWTHKDMNTMSIEEMSKLISKYNPHLNNIYVDNISPQGLYNLITTLNRANIKKIPSLHFNTFGKSISFEENNEAYRRFKEVAYVNGKVVKLSNEQVKQIFTRVFPLS